MSSPSASVSGRPLMALLRRPRLTLQARLAALYAGLFLVSGVTLLAVLGVVVGNNILFGQSSQAAPGSPPGAAAGNSQGGGSHLHLLPAVVVAVMVLVSLALGWLIAGRLLRPLRSITATARDISARNLDQRLSVDGPNDEIRELGETLDGLFGRLEASFQAQRHFVANASHELRTPLPPNARCSRSRSPIQTPLPRRCGPPASSCWRSAGSRNASSRPCSPWPPVSAESNAGNPSTSPGWPGE
jgi:HAMP domain-containing protein